MTLSVPVIVLAVLAVGSAVLTIVFDRRGRRNLLQLSKPLTTILIIGVAVLAPIPAPAAYKTFILAGLAFSLLGDIALTLSEKWFQAGIAAFLVAHVFYVLASEPGPARPLSVGIFLPFILFGLRMYFILR